MDSQSTTTDDHRNMRQDTDTGAREHHRYSMRRWRAGICSPAGSFEMLSICNVDGVAYIRRMYAFFSNNCKESTEEK